MEPDYNLAPFSRHVHTLWNPVTKMDEIFFGEAVGSKTTRKHIRIDFFPFLGSLGAIFQRNPKMDVFQILNFLEALSQLPLDLESRIIFWQVLTLCLTKCSIPLGLVWFGLIWYAAKILKNGCPEKTYQLIFDFLGLKALS